jgi:hypothetical protein
MNSRFSALSLVAPFLMVGCVHLSDDPRSYQGMTHIALTGTAGSSVAVSYVQANGRVDISTELPYRLDAAGVSEFEIRKINPTDTVVAECRYDGEGVHVASGGTSGPGSRGLAIQVSNGFAVRQF